MPIEIDGVKNTYKVFVDSLKLVNFATKQEVKGSMDISSDGLIISFNPDEALESTTKFVLMAQVSFRQRVGNDWVVAKDSEGTEYVERMETKFTSGKRPDHILPQHLICSYPLDKMYNFYPKETNTGYICLSENYSYLFDKVPEGYEQKLRFSTLDGKSQTSDFEHFKSKEVTNEKYELSFDLSKFAFDNQNIYKLEIVNIPKRIAVQNENVTTGYTVVNGDSIRQIAAEGDFNQLETKQICELNFRVSKYNTLKEKLAVVKLSGTAVVYGESATLKNMEVNLITDDYFDGFECQTYYNDTSLLRMNANLNQTDWYRKSIYSKMYAAYSKKAIGNERVHSTPPADALDIFNPDYCNHWNLKDSEIQANFASGLNQTGNYGYYVVFYCHDDIMTLRTKISEKRDKHLPLNDLETEILNYSTPPLYEKGKYPYTLSYRLPGKGIITSSFTENFIVK